jgi:hypothetical protein
MIGRALEGTHIFLNASTPTSAVRSTPVGTRTAFIIIMIIYLFNFNCNWVDIPWQ